MIIQCERCNRKFKIDDSMIKYPGNRVRCSKCGNTFFVERKEEISKNEINSEHERDHSHSGFVYAEENFESKSLSHKTTEAKIELEEESITQDVKEISQESPQPHKESEIYIEDNLELKSSHQKTEEEKIELEQEAITQGQKEIPQESPQPHKESEIYIEKTPIADGINWEEFVSITRTKPEEENLDSKSDKEFELEKRENPSEFNWAKLAIDHEPEESLLETEPPKLFDEALEEVKHDSRRNPETIRIKLEPDVPINPTPNALKVDNEKLIITKKNLRSSSYASDYSSMGIKPEKTVGLVGRIIKRLSYVFMILLILTIIIGAGMVILANQGLIPQEKVSRISESILSKLPVKFTETPGRDFKVSDLLGRWISTRNGLLYVVSGNITNQSDYVVNYVKIRSAFISGGKNLFEQVAYAGNTFTENELETLPIEAMVEKLNRKNGDISFDNPKKLAGLNFGIEPGESVPFFSIFPSESRILGLKYKINIADFDRAQ
jgi:predicted Zn finger-like uncharacterized protein